MTLNRAVLELDADVDSDGTMETGIFHLVGNLEIQQGITTDYLLASGQGSVLNAVTSSSADTIGNIIGTVSEEAARGRRGFYLDLGGGEHTIEANFIGWEGATDGSENALQWGNTGDGGTKADATGEDPLTQLQTLIEYLRVGEYDSRGVHARLRLGEYADGTYGPDGRFDDYLHVVIRHALFTRVAEDPVAFDGSIVLAETQDWSGVLDSLGRVEW